MKKGIIFFAVVAFAAAVTSCGKSKCYECTISSIANTTIEVCNGTATTTIDTVSTTISTGTLSEKQYVATLELLGYACNKQ